MKSRWMLIVFAVWAAAAQAQMMRPPAFIGGIPGKAQFQAMQLQRHQARTLLYREALEELRKNPQAADVPECPSGKAAQGVLCLQRPDAAQTPAAPVVAAPAPTPAAPVPAPAAPAVAAVPAAPAPVAKPAPAVVPAAPPAVASAARPSRRIAVLFGNNDYKTPIPELDTPIADVSKTAQVLEERFGFETRVLKNAGKAQTIEALNRVAAEAAPEDSVLLFYAGHGYLMDDTNMGFWIPADASVKTAANWISNTDISKLLAAIGARQLILVSDSCFSGSLTREHKVSAGAATPEEVLRQRSVLVLTSGGEEPVSDEGKDGHSIFAWNLIKTLDAARGTMPGYEVWRTVHNGVVKEYQQQPQYGAVVSAGHVAGGDYLFQPR